MVYYNDNNRYNVYIVKTNEDDTKTVKTVAKNVDRGRAGDIIARWNFENNRYCHDFNEYITYKKVGVPLF